MTAAAWNRIYLVIIAVLVLVIAAMVYKFLIAGSTVKGEDGRVAVVLEPGERAFMLHEMRDFVGGLQAISDGLSRGDMQAVAKAARAVGTAKAHDVPVAMLGKLPIEFKKLALGTHREFDTIAADAESVRTPKHTLQQLSDVLQKCVACHSTYQLKEAASQ